MLKALNLERNGYVGLLPIMSGYRDSETLEPEFTTDYGFVRAEDNPERFTVFFPLAEIKSASFFDFATWKKHFRPDDGSTPRPPPDLFTLIGRP